MRGQNIILIGLIVLGLVVFSACETDTFREFYGKAIHSYTPPSSPDLADYPKQFLVEDEDNYVLSFEDAIVAPDSYDLSGFYDFTESEMCSIVNDGGYDCRDEDNNLVTGSFFAQITGAIAADAEVNPLYSCRKDAGDIIYDHYVSTSYPCSMSFGSGHITQRLLGRIYKTEQEGTTSLNFCYDSSLDDYFVNLDSCAGYSSVDSSAGSPSLLGYVYDYPEPGTVPVTRCKMHHVSERYVVDGTECVNDDDVFEFTFYVLPACSETDGGFDPGVKGTTISANGESFTDYCDGDISLVEYFCDATEIKTGMDFDGVDCDYMCSDGACVPEFPEPEYNLTINKTAFVNWTSHTIKYDIVVENKGSVLDGTDVVVLEDFLPSVIMELEHDTITPAPSQVKSPNTLIWLFNHFGNSSSETFTSDNNAYVPRYSSDGIFKSSFIVSFDPDLIPGVDIINHVNLSVEDFIAGDESIVTIPSPPELMRIVSIEADNVGGNPDAIPEPVCPDGMNKFGQIYEFHGRDNSFGRKFAFCANPAVNGVVNTCSVNSAADIGPWTSSCEPAACPDGMAALDGLIRHGYHIYVGNDRFNYVNMYSRVCLSDNVFDSGSVKSCVDTGTQVETGQCDTPADLYCPAGELPIDVVIGDPVYDAYKEQRGGEDRYRHHHFVYNRVCVDFKSGITPLANCRDTDGGINYEEPGFVYKPSNHVVPDDVLGKDVRINSTHLEEHYCTSDGDASVVIECSSPCVDNNVYFQSPDFTSFFVDHVGSCTPAQGVAYCGNDIIEIGEECEQDSDCAVDEICTDCQCVAAGPPWAINHSCANNSDCISGYCDPNTNTCKSAPGEPDYYIVSIPDSIPPAGLSSSNFDNFDTVLIGTCDDNEWVQSALGSDECDSLDSGRALIWLQDNPYRLIIAGDSSAGVNVALNVFENSDNYNLHGERVDVFYNGSTIEDIVFAHCFDDIENYDETGVDCGGSCDACPEEEYPPATPGPGPSGGGGGGGGGSSWYEQQEEVEEEATECYDDWICDAWGPCTNAGLQFRKCYLNDYPECDLIMDKPAEQRSCEPPVIPEPEPEPTCFDGIQNQGEEGIDCGGPCPPCPGKGIAAWLIALIAFLAIAGVALGFVWYYFRFLKKPDVLAPLKKYVVQARAKNIPDSRIRQILRKQGWSADKIGKAMKK